MGATQQERPRRADEYWGDREAPFPLFGRGRCERWVVGGRRSALILSPPSVVVLNSESDERLRASRCGGFLNPAFSAFTGEVRTNNGGKFAPK